MVELVRIERFENKTLIRESDTKVNNVKGGDTHLERFKLTRAQKEGMTYFVLS
jgi:hypothetical protein